MLVALCLLSVLLLGLVMTHWRSRTTEMEIEMTVSDLDVGNAIAGLHDYALLNDSYFDHWDAAVASQMIAGMSSIPGAVLDDGGEEQECKGDPAEVEPNSAIVDHYAEPKEEELELPGMRDEVPKGTVLHSDTRSRFDDCSNEKLFVGTIKIEPHHLCTCVMELCSVVHQGLVKRFG
eukprot:TRINITY_DN55960_c0_g1_i3.p1 TRINITY_DN55960_c0_g1~~TRINITY_DN55960_c0_g1_i3.p1  ORF type:complete len:177 (+),score=12.68 TRINITY_DN55960_c0_g1_i3:28-558(+)